MGKRNIKLVKPPTALEAIARREANRQAETLWFKNHGTRHDEKLYETLLQNLLPVLKGL